MRTLAFCLSGVSTLVACGGLSTQPTRGVVTAYAPFAKAVPRSSKITFSYTGAQQSFTVPEGITHVTIQAWGAGGGSVKAVKPDAGGFVKASISVTPGEPLAVFVGGTATGGYGSNGGFNGGGNSTALGGGGGASDVRQGGTALSNRVVVAGGGGGSGYLEFECHFMHAGARGGNGGDLVGARGWSTNIGKRGTLGGFGGTQQSGGTLGGRRKHDSKGSSGTLGIGGDGGRGGGGGGGGYYGGGGGGAFFRYICGGYDLYQSGGGGGGSSYAETTAKGVRMRRGGGATGNGVIVISW